MITTHYYNSRGEVQADKDHLLEELDPTEEEAEIHYTRTPSTIVTSVVSKKSGASATSSKKANTTSPNLMY